jgi:hypothetical protein
MGLSHRLPKLEPLDFGFITFFSNLRTFELIFEASLVPCTQGTFPNTKNYVNTKVYN